MIFYQSLSLFYLLKDDDCINMSFAIIARVFFFNIHENSSFGTFLDTYIFLHEDADRGWVSFHLGQLAIVTGETNL